MVVGLTFSLSNQYALIVTVVADVGAVYKQMGQEIRNEGVIECH